VGRRPFDGIVELCVISQPLPVCSGNAPKPEMFTPAIGSGAMNIAHYCALAVSILALAAGSHAAAFSNLGVQ
jgi:hypothetical protein